jgi:23S rRNA (cytosine1962-C5)-methyltransferase
MNKYQFLVSPVEKEYQCIALGEGLRIERFGKNILRRSDANAMWALTKAMREMSVNGICTPGSKGQSVWKKKVGFDQDWTISVFDGLRFNLRATTSKNIGFFPEQLSQWRWLASIIEQEKERKLSVLNLCAYTGGATMAAAREGAEVCHVDASKSVVAWAKENARLSGLSEAPIRWIVDDMLTFVEREVRRERKYDIIIMDPPAMGHTPAGKLVTFNQIIHPLLGAIKAVAPDPVAFVFNGYAMGYSGLDLSNLVATYYPDQMIEAGELGVVDQQNNFLSCSAFARFYAE